MMVEGKEGFKTRLENTMTHVSNGSRIRACVMCLKWTGVDMLHTSASYFSSWS